MVSIWWTPLGWIHRDSSPLSSMILSLIRVWERFDPSIRDREELRLNTYISKFWGTFSWISKKIKPLFFSSKFFHTKRFPHNNFLVLFIPLNKRIVTIDPSSTPCFNSNVLCTIYSFLRFNSHLAIIGTYNLKIPPTMVDWLDSILANIKPQNYDYASHWLAIPSQWAVGCGPLS